MRYLIILWALPLGLFWGWYFLSLNDINFGSIYLSRRLHDAVFQVYGDIVGMEPSAIPALLAQAFAFDTLIILAIVAFRRRKQIRAWWESRRRTVDGQPAEKAEIAPLPAE